jgi:hypothetical protein
MNVHKILTFAAMGPVRISLEHTAVSATKVMRLTPLGRAVLMWMSAPLTRLSAMVVNVRTHPAAFSAFVPQAHISAPPLTSVKTTMSVNSWVSQLAQGEAASTLRGVTPVSALLALSWILQVAFVLTPGGAPAGRLSTRVSVRKVWHPSHLKQSAAAQLVSPGAAHVRFATLLTAKHALQAWPKQMARPVRM